MGKSGIAIERFMHLQAHGQNKGDEHPMYGLLHRLLILSYTVFVFVPMSTRSISGSDQRMVMPYGRESLESQLRGLCTYRLIDKNKGDEHPMYGLLHRSLILSYTYKGLSGIKIESMFEPSTDSRTRGHSLKLMKHRSLLDLKKYFFSERVVNRWNELDEDTVSAIMVNIFKSKLQRLRQLKTSFNTDT